MRWPSRAALHFTDTVGKKTQRPLCRNCGVQLAHRTSGCIARIDKGFFAFVALRDARSLARVQGLKIIAAHIHLASHFQHRRRIL